MASNRSGAMVTRSLVLAAVFACVWTGGTAAAQSPLFPTLDPIAGARLFEAKGCGRCHAIGGVGAGGGPDLGHVERARSLYDLAAALWNHVPQMSSRIWGSTAAAAYVTPDEVSDLMAFLSSPTSVTTRESLERALGVLDAPGDPRHGRQLVTEKGCLGCHSLSRPGGKVAGRLDDLKGPDSPWSVVAAMWNHAFLMYAESQAGGRPWPSLSAIEMADLVAFLRLHAYSRSRS
jgi:mono/diheme cytochrome c family protein